MHVLCQLCLCTVHKETLHIKPNSSSAQMMCPCSQWSYECPSPRVGDGHQSIQHCRICNLLPAPTNSLCLDCGHSFLSDPSFICFQGRQKFRLNPPTIFTSSASVEPNQDDWCSKQQWWWNQQQCHQLTNAGALPAKRLFQHIQRLAVKAAAEPAMRVPAV